MSIERTASTFAWEYRSAILPTVVCFIPLAFEAGRVIKAIYDDPGVIKRNALELKSKICHAFQKQPEENDEQFRKRLWKNIAITALAITAIAAAAVCPFFVLPGAFAIPAALSAIQAVGLAIKYIYKTPDIIGKVKNFIKDSFTQREGETIEAFKLRRTKAILQIAGYAVLFGAAVAGICYGAQIAILLSKATTFWDLGSLLPNQTSTVVFLEYAAVGILHAVQAVRQWKQGNKDRAISHIVCALLSIAFPIGYLMEPGHGMRLHHSFIGLILQLAPWRAVRIFGGMVTFDSSLYFISGQRGHVITERLLSYEWKRFEKYDFMNTVVDNLPFVLGALSGMALLERINDFFLKKKKRKKSAGSQKREDGSQKPEARSQKIEEIQKLEERNSEIRIQNARNNQSKIEIQKAANL